MVALAVVPGSRPVGAGELRAGPDDYREAVARLVAGDTLHLDPGIYRRGLDLHRLAGTEAAPISVVGATGDRRTVFVGIPNRNTISIVDSAHVRVADLDLDGRGTATDGVKAEGPSRFAHDIVLERLRIRGYRASQQNVGISTKCPAWNWIIRDVRISDVGTGMYLGDSDGSAPFVRGLIERNEVTRTRGYALQIKHQQPWPDVVAVPGDDGQTILRHNRFAKDASSATGTLARPSVLLGHGPLAGRGTRDRFLVYGNVFLDNPTEALLQAEGNASVYGNIFVNRAGPAVVLRNHNDRPREMAVFHNTVVARDEGIVLRGADPAFRQVIVGNAIFAAGVEPARLAQGNFVRAFADVGRYLAEPGPPNTLPDLVPRNDALDDPADAAGEFRALPGADVDARGVRRRAGVFGAYVPRPLKEADAGAR
ncbi:MAG: right-handed parallel beta-helix repeat-containing protein [Burkholderiales bacterium]